MLGVFTIIWTIICLLFITIVCSVFTLIISLIYWFKFKKPNWKFITILNLLIVIPFHNYFIVDWSVNDVMGLRPITIVLGFTFYSALYFANKVHFFTINYLNEKYTKRS